MYTAIGIADPDLHAFPDLVFFLFINFPHFNIIFQFSLTNMKLLYTFVSGIGEQVYRIIPIFLRIRISRRKDPNSPLAAQIHAAVLVERNISILYILT